MLGAVNKTRKYLVVLATLFSLYAPTISYSQQIFNLPNISGVGFAYYVDYALASIAQYQGFQGSSHTPPAGASWYTCQGYDAVAGGVLYLDASIGGSPSVTLLSATITTANVASLSVRVTGGSSNVTYACGVGQPVNTGNVAITSSFTPN